MSPDEPEGNRPPQGEPPENAEEGFASFGAPEEAAPVEEPQYAEYEEMPPAQAYQPAAEANYDPGPQEPYIPMPGDAESLNVAAAGAIALYEALGRRGP